MKKMNKRTAEKKEQFAKLHAFVRSLSSLCLESSFFLSPYSVPAPVPAFVTAFVPAILLALVPTLLSHSKSPIIMLSGRVPTPAAVSFCEIPALLSLLFVLSPPLPLGPSPCRKFK